MIESDVYVDVDRVYRLFETDSGQLGIAVMSGGIAAFEVKMMLNQEELDGYRAEGVAFLARLALKLSQNPQQFDARTYG
jgi:hypothetical protein